MASDIQLRPAAFHAPASCLIGPHHKVHTLHSRLQRESQLTATGMPPDPQLGISAE